MPNKSKLPLQSASKLLPLKKSSRKKTIILWFVFVIGGLLLVAGIITFFAYPIARTAYTTAQQAKASVTEAQALIGKSKYREAAQKLQDAKEELSATSFQINRLRWLRYIPFIGRQIKAAENIITAGRQTAAAGVTALTYADKIFSPLSKQKDLKLSSLTTEEKAGVLQKIVESPPVLQSVKADLNLALYAIQEVPSSFVIQPLQDIANPLRTQLADITSALTMYEPIIEIAPRLLGYPTDQTYLFLLQNNDELRPTGGFIGSYGILKVKNAEVTSFTTDDTYNLDNNIRGTGVTEKPWPLYKYADPIRTEWFMRDGNWAADFPQAAKDVMNLYKIESGPEKLTGVIATDPTAISRLIELTGNVTVRGITFTPQNLNERLEYEVGVAFKDKGISLTDRKNIIGDMSKILLERLMSMPKDRWGELWQTVQGLLTQKHLLVYSAASDVQERLQSQVWSGHIPAVTGDYVYFVDSNMGSLKTDQVMQRSITHTVTDENGRLKATTAITYVHTGITAKLASLVTRYRTYVRLYVPQGSELISTDGSTKFDNLNKPSEIETKDEFGMTSFGTFVNTEPLETRTLTVNYYLPDSLRTSFMRDKKYQLYVQKQPGTHSHGLTVSLNLGTNPSSASPAFSDKNKHTWQSDLLTDRQFTATW